MIKATLKNGFEVEIAEDRLDDYDLLEDMAKLDDGNVSAIPALYARILGAEQYEALKAHLRMKEGMVRITSMEAAMTEIFQLNNGQVKNS